MSEEIKNKINTADKAYREGNFEESEVKYIEIDKLSPNNLTILGRLGAIALLNNQADKAIELYNNALKKTPWYLNIWPLNADLKYRLATAYYRKDDFEKATEYFYKAAGPFQVGLLKDLKELKALGKQTALFINNTSYVIEGPRESKVSFVVTDPLPVVKVSVNGSEPVNFFIDTGGAEIILDNDFAKSVDAQIVSSMSASYAGQKKADTGLGKIDTLVIGDFTVKNVPIHTIDVSPTSEIFGGLKMKGIIGTRFLMHFNSTIDYKNGVLALNRLGQSANKDSGLQKAIPFYLADMHMILAKGTVNNNGPMLLFVDTGLAGAGFTSPESLLHKYGINVDWNKAKESSGGGGKVKATDILVECLTLGLGENKIIENNITGKAIDGGTPVIGDMLGFHIGGLISHQFFRDYAVTFDFERMKIVVR